MFGLLGSSRQCFSKSGTSLEVPWHYSKPQYNMVLSINETIYGTRFLKILSRSDSFLSARNLPGLFL